MFVQTSTPSTVLAIHHHNPPSKPIMASIKYTPFKDHREVGHLLIDLFHLCWSYMADSFTLGWLQKTIDLPSGARYRRASGQRREH